MASNNTHITILLDRSGSMESIRDDIIGGFNAFLAEQQQSEEKTTLTLVQFDTNEPYEVLCDAIPLVEAKPLSRNTYVPRGGTPLLDALGRCINECEAMVLGTEKKPGKKPDKVLFVIVTDGQENSSREFTKQQVSGQIEARTADGWQFVFLSADLDAMNEAMNLGVAHSHSIAYDRNRAGTSNAFDALSRNVKQYRASSGNTESLQFDETDRARQENEQRRSGK